MNRQIHIARNGEKPGALPEEKVHELMEIGFLLPDDVCRLVEHASCATARIKGAGRSVSGQFSGSTGRLLDDFIPHIRPILLTERFRAALGAARKAVHGDELMPKPLAPRMTACRSLCIVSCRRNNSFRGAFSGETHCWALSNRLPVPLRRNSAGLTLELLPPWTANFPAASR